MEAWESELVETVSRLAREKFAERAAQHDLAGSFPHENVNELRELGIPGMALPKEIGGLGIGAHAHIRIVEEVAYGDASTAVALNMHLLGADVIHSIPMFERGKVVVEDIARNGALICGPASVPTGDLDNRKAGFSVAEDGEYLVVNGKTGFASMSDAAKYIIIGGRVPRGEGAEDDLALTIPEKDNTPGLKVLNNWDAMGLRGTASHDVLCEDARIPKSQGAVIPAAIFRALAQGQGGQSGVTQNRARGALGILAIWLGNAQAIFDFTVDYVGQRHGYMAGVGLAGAEVPGYRADEGWAQINIGQMDHWLETGRVVLYDMVRSLDETFPDQQLFTRKVTRAVYHLRRMGEEIALTSMKVCGAHAYVKKRPMERMVRDLIGGNVMAWKTDHLALTLGRGALGMPITIAGPAGS